MDSLDAPELDAAQRRCRHYATVEKAIAYIRLHALRQPSLDEIAAAVHLSPHHLQRVFSEWAGISPKRFLQCVTRESVVRRLRQQDNVLSTAGDAGLSGGGRVHDLVLRWEAMTPGQVQTGGRGLRIGFGFGPTPFGSALIAWTDRGICHLAFDHPPGPQAFMALAARWPQARCQQDDADAARRLAPIFRLQPERGSIQLQLQGTNFQLKVWEALLRTAPGEALSYGALARQLGTPGAARAVGRALATNTLAVLIPCHRVLREGGEFHHYRWGVERKMALMGWEAARRPDIEP